MALNLVKLAMVTYVKGNTFILNLSKKFKGNEISPNLIEITTFSLIDLMTYM